MADKEFVEKLDEALGINEDYGKNNFKYPDPTEAKPTPGKTKKMKSAKGAHRPDPGTDYDQMERKDDFNEEDTRIKFDKKEPEKTSQTAEVKPKKELPKLK
jgi:hypothetical protein